MKKHLVLGALAVLALAACTKSEVVELNKGNEISLTAVTGKNLTKAHDGYCNSDMPADFAVWAATDGKKYFEAQTYKRDGTSNTYKSESARYWPTTAVDFFAAKNYGGPATLTPTSGATSLAVADYTVTTTVADQTDFIYAVTKGATKDGGPAVLNFRHALSQIEFQAKNQNTGIHVFIDKIQVVNVYSKGNFSVSNETTTNYQNHTHDENAEASDPRTGQRCSWGAQSTPDTYTLNFYVDDANPGVDVKNGGSADLSVSDPTGKEYNDKTMYLIPQTVENLWGGSGTPASNEAYFLINAIIYNVAGTEVDKANDVVLWGTKTGSTYTSKPIAVPIPASTEWEDGLRYVYTFNFTKTGTGGVDPGTGEDVLTPIELTVSVDDFVDAGNKDVDVK